MQRRTIHQRQDLEGDAVALADVAGLVDDAHAAAAQLAEQSVLAQPVGRRVAQGGPRAFGLATWRGSMPMDASRKAFADQGGELTRKSAEILVDAGPFPGRAAAFELDGQ